MSAGSPTNPVDGALFSRGAKWRFDILEVAMIGLLILFYGIFVVLFLLSPIYARLSAEAFERGENWLVVFIKPQPNRMSQRDKAGRPSGFVGIPPPQRDLMGYLIPGINPSDDPRFGNIVDLDILKNLEGLDTAPSDKNGEEWEKLEREYPDTMLGLRPADLEELWKLAKTGGGRKTSSPDRIHKYWPIRLWVRYINLWGYYSLVGVRWFWSIKRYPLPKVRIKEHIGPDGSITYEFEDSEPGTDPENPTTDPNWSDHVRTGPFTWPVVVEVILSDGTRWRFIVVVNVRFKNLWLPFNRHERWGQFLSQTIRDAVVRTCRGLKTKDIMGLEEDEEGKKGKSAEARDKLTQAVYATEARLLEVIGLRFDVGKENGSSQGKNKYKGAVQITSIKFVAQSNDDQDALTAPWRGERKGQEEATRESKVIKKVGRVVRKLKQYGLATQAYQALENVAKDKGNTIVMGDLFGSRGGTGQASTDDETRRLLALILNEMKKSRSDDDQGGDK